MTPKALFTIILKIAGIYLIVQEIDLIAPLINAILQQIHSSEPPLFDFWQFSFIVLLMLGLYLLIQWYCIFKTDWVINKLHLDKGFDTERFEIKIHRSLLLRISIIVIGAVIITDSLPLLCKEVFYFLRTSDKYERFKDNPSSGFLIYYFIKFTIGFTLMSCSRLLVNFIELKRRNFAKVNEA